MKWKTMPCDHSETHSGAIRYLRQDAQLLLVVVCDREAPGGVVGSRKLDDRTTLVGSGGESADDWLIREVPGRSGAWLVTSDRALREAAGGSADRLIGCGSFLRELDD